MYERESRLKVSIQYKLVEHFVAGTAANVASDILDMQANNTAIKFYMRLRVLIASTLPSYELAGETENIFSKKLETASTAGTDPDNAYQRDCINFCVTAYH